MRRGNATGWLYWLTLLLCVSLPFEPIRPLFSLGWLDVNHLKLLLLATFVLLVIGLRDVWRTLPSFWPAGVFLAVALISAIAAPSDRGEAVKFVGRLASGLYALVLVRYVTTTQARVVGLVWAIGIGAAGSALVGLGEAAGWTPLQPILATFKLAPTHVGGDLRVSASFQYATIAAMFFELATPLALILAATQRTRAGRGLATAIAMLCSASVVLTITRAGVVALGIVLTGLLALAVFQPAWRKLAVPTALAGAGMILTVGGLAVRLPAFDTRFATENDWSWYDASYSVPTSLTLNADAPTEATIVANNTGQAVWTASGEHPFALAYRWLSADDTAQLDLPSTVLDLPHDVSPGESVVLTVPVSANVPSGEYRLAWGMLQQNVLWFHDRGHPDAETVVQVVAGIPTGPIRSELRSDTSIASPPVPRSALWAAALEMFVRHPLLGIGPDNFRHVYGEYLALPAFDQRVHANNLYLELLADVGVLGAAAFGLVLGSAARGLVSTFRTRPSVLQTVSAAALGASVAVFLLHGTLDYFLDFTPVYLLFWIVVGLSSALPEVK